MKDDGSILLPIFQNILGASISTLTILIPLIILL